MNFEKMEEKFHRVNVTSICQRVSGVIIAVKLSLQPPVMKTIKSFIAAVGQHKRAFYKQQTMHRNLTTMGGNKSNMCS